MEQNISKPAVLDAQQMYDSELIKLQTGLQTATTRHEKDFELRSELRAFLMGRQGL